MWILDNLGGGRGGGRGWGGTSYGKINVLLLFTYWASQVGDVGVIVKDIEVERKVIYPLIRNHAT